MDVEEFDDNNNESLHHIKINIHANANIDQDIQKEINLVNYTGSSINTLTIATGSNIVVDNDSYHSLSSHNLGHNLGHNNSRNNSPITISDSNNNSANNSASDISDDDSQSETERNDIKNERISIDSNNKCFKKFSYNDIEKSLNKYYDKESKYSSELDILITYLNGQKFLYTHAKNVTQQKLNLLMIPSLIMSTAIAIFAPVLQCNYINGIIIAGLNAFIAFILSLLNYLKLEASVEMYLHVANQYDKLETSLEIASNKLLFIENGIDQDKMVLGKIKEFEKQLNEIKDSCTILIPVEIKQRFPIICYINIFSFIKKMEMYKKNLIVKFKDVKNEIRYILYKWRTQSVGYSDATIEYLLAEKEKEKRRLDYLYGLKETIKDELVHYKNAYNYIDELFTREIKLAETNKYFWPLCLFCPSPKPKFDTCNPIIDKYLKFIFMD